MREATMRRVAMMIGILRTTTHTVRVLPLLHHLSQPKPRSSGDNVVVFTIPEQLSALKERIVASSLSGIRNATLTTNSSSKSFDFSSSLTDLVVRRYSLWYIWIRI